MREHPAILQDSLGVRTVRVAQRWGGRIAGFARKEPLGIIALAVCIGTVILAVFAYDIAPFDPIEPEISARLEAPSASHWFGTDSLGRDLYSRIVHGARVSLIVAFFSIGIGTTTGYLLGLVSGYLGGGFDLASQRLVDVMLAFPSILLAMVLVTLLGAGIDKVIIAIAVGFIPGAARVSRGVVLSAKENTYVDAARAIGASDLRIMLRHILPNCLAPFLILASVGLGGAILAEASLSFLGLGVPPPHPSWGRMLSGAATTYFRVAPWLVVFPGLAIMLLVLAFNLFGDALRDLWDPKLRGRT